MLFIRWIPTTKVLILYFSLGQMETLSIIINMYIPKKNEAALNQTVSRVQSLNNNHIL